MPILETTLEKGKNVEKIFVVKKCDNRMQKMEKTVCITNSQFSPCFPQPEHLFLAPQSFISHKWLIPGVSVLFSVRAGEY